MRSLKTRTLSTIVMVTGFTAILYMGHVVVCLLIVCIQVRSPSVLCAPQAALTSQPRTASLGLVTLLFRAAAARSARCARARPRAASSRAAV